MLDIHVIIKFVGFGSCYTYGCCDPVLCGYILWSYVSYIHLHVRCTGSWTQTPHLWCAGYAIAMVNLVGSVQNPPFAWLSESILYVMDAARSICLHVRLLLRIRVELGSVQYRDTAPGKSAGLLDMCWGGWDPHFPKHPASGSPNSAGLCLEMPVFIHAVFCQWAGCPEGHSATSSHWPLVALWGRWERRRCDTVCEWEQAWVENLATRLSQ